MGITSPIKALHHEDVEVAQAEAPHLIKVTWYKDKGLKKLYGLISVIGLAAATTGYDGYAPIDLSHINAKVAPKVNA